MHSSSRRRQLTKTHDALAAERRRLPMVLIDKPYSFEGPNGKVTLLDLFEGRKQLLLYHFMFGPNSDAGCDGCSMVMDHLPHTAHLNARDVSVAIVSRAPLKKLEAYRKRMGWTFRWFSSFGTDFSYDLGVGPKEPRPGEYQDGEEHGWSVFLRDGDHVYRTYFTTSAAGSCSAPPWLSRHHALRPAGGLGKFAERLAAGQTLRMVAPP